GEGRDQEAVVAAAQQAGHRAGGEAPDAVRAEPLAALGHGQNPADLAPPVEPAACFVVHGPPLCIRPRLVAVAPGPPRGRSGTGSAAPETGLPRPRIPRWPRAVRIRTPAAGTPGSGP